MAENLGRGLKWCSLKIDAGHYGGSLWIATEIMILNVFNLYMHYICILSVTILGMDRSHVFKMMSVYNNLKQVFLYSLFVFFPQWCMIQKEP